MKCFSKLFPYLELFQKLDKHERLSSLRWMKPCTGNAALQGERETNELNNKLAQFSENAMKFTMDGGLSAYDYKAEEEEAGEDVNFKALAGAQTALAIDGPTND